MTERLSRRLAICAQVWLLSAAAGCQSVPPPPKPAPVRSKAPAAASAVSEPRPSRESFQFAIVTDRTGGHRPFVFESALRKANLMQPAFVMSVGDLIEGYTPEVAQIAQQWNEFGDFVATLEMPFFFVPGNHDISNPVMADVWQERFGPAYYHFVYRDVLFLCLNTEDGAPASISDAQVQAFERAIKHYPNVRWTFLFMHRPLWNPSEGATGQAQFARIEQALRGRRYTVFAGHYHTYMKSVRNEQSYIVLATTGGHSRLRGPLFGEFDQMAWVSMSDAGPRIANLLLDGIVDEDVRTDASAKRVDALVRDLGVSIDNAYTFADSFAGGTAKLRIRNDTPHALRFSGNFGPSAPLEPSPHAVALELPSHAAREIPVKIRVEHAQPIASLPPVSFEWRAKVDSGAEPTVLTNQLDYVVSRAYALKPRSAAVVVDGRLDEWGTLAMSVPMRVAPPLKAPAYRFELSYDPSNVYVAVDVVDDRVLSVADKLPWEQDGIEVCLDPRDDPERAGNRRDYSEPWRTFAYLAFSPLADAEPALFEAQKVPAGVRVRSVRTPRGYSAEIALPHSVLNRLRQSGEWDALRFNIAVHDADVDGGTREVRWWQPDWHQAENLPGSGTFLKLESGRSPRAR